MYVKLFEDLLDSTVWVGTTPEVRCVWITILLLADRDGMVDISIPGLARRAGVSVEICEQALKLFESPDPYSKSREHDGRRLLRAGDSPMWEIVNYKKYRDMQRRRDRSEYMKSYMRDRRALDNVSQVCKHLLTPVSNVSLQADTDTDVSNHICASDDARACAKQLPDDFTKFWTAYPKKKAKHDALKAWKQTSKIRPPLDDVLKKLEQLKRSEDWQKDGGQFIPFPATWLRAGRWDDEVKTELKRPETAWRWPWNEKDERRVKSSNDPEILDSWDRYKAECEKLGMVPNSWPRFNPNEWRGER